MEDVPVDRVMNGDSFSVNQVDPNQMCLTRFGDDSIIHLDVPCSRDDALVDKDAAAPKPCLSPTEVRTLTLANDLPPASTASKATRIIFYQPPLWFYLTEKIYRTSVQYAAYCSSLWKMKVLET